MAIRTVVTRGYGNGTFSGTIALVTTRGYAIGAALALAIYTVSVLCSLSPTINRVVNLSPTLRRLANPSPTKEVISG